MKLVTAGVYDAYMRAYENKRWAHLFALGHGGVALVRVSGVGCRRTGTGIGVTNAVWLVNVEGGEGRRNVGEWRF